MKCSSYLKMTFTVAMVMTIPILITGCASSSNSKETASEKTKASQVPPLPAGVTLHKDKDIQGVWLAPGFNFKGYDTLSIDATSFKAVERPNEVKERTAAIAAVRWQLVESIGATKLFGTVSINPLAPGAHGLRLANTIIEYEKGGGAGRYFAGIYGAGMPVIKVRGEVFDGEKLVCVYEIKRSGESAGAWMVGGFMSDLGVQASDVRDLATDLADFMKRVAAKQSLDSDSSPHKS